MNTYSSDELVRLELLAYCNPEGLHPIEENWRDLCRKLAQDAREMRIALISHHGNVPDEEKGQCFVCTLPKKPFIILPAKFSPKKD